MREQSQINNMTKSFRIFAILQRMELKALQLKSFFYQRINIWNDQPKEVVKRRLDQAWGNHSLRFWSTICVIFFDMIIKETLSLRNVKHK